MEQLEVVLVFLCAVLISAIVNQLVPKVSTPLIQIVLGIIIALFAISPITPSLDPEFFLVMLIAPLLYDEARRADRVELWKNITPVLSLAIGLVFVSTLLVGVITHLLIPSIPLAAAFALGAMLGPTDAVAVAALPKEINIGNRNRNILKGESLINDASGLVSFQVAIAAAMTGTFSFAEAGVDFLISFFGGILVGVVLGIVANTIRHWVRSVGLNSTTFHVLFDVLLPFIIYLIAEPFGASGIIAVVAGGLIMSLSNRDIGPSYAKTNIVSSSVWKTLSFALNGIVFVLLGTQLPKAMEDTWGDANISNFELVAFVLLITAAVMVIRLAWTVGMELVRCKHDKRAFCKGNFRSAAIMTLGGSKGAVTLAIAFTIPYALATGEPFPQRDLIIFIACGTILVTLLISNFILPLFAHKEDKTREAQQEEDAAYEAYIDALRSVIEMLTAKESPKKHRAIRTVIHRYNKRINHVKDKHDINTGSGAFSLDNRLKAIRWQEEYVSNIIQAGVVDGKMVNLRLATKYLTELKRTEKKLIKNDKSIFSKFHTQRSILQFKKWWRAYVTTQATQKDYSPKEKELLELKGNALKYTIDKLREEIASDGDEALTEESSAILLAYQRNYKTILVALGKASPAPSVSSDDMTTYHKQVMQLQKEAYEYEMEVIQDMKEDGRLPAAFAHTLHNNARMMLLDLEGDL